MEHFSIHRARERTATPWKNGGGLTCEVVVSPKGANFDTFDWRISIATVRASGPFSTLPGIDRQLVLLEGSLTLQIGAQNALELSPTSAPLALPGDEPTHAELLDGPVTDLNVMTRRGCCRAGLRRHTLRAALTLNTHQGSTVLIPMKSVGIEHAGVAQLLQARDAIVLLDESALRLTPIDLNTTLYIIEITKYI